MAKKKVWHNLCSFANPSGCQMTAARESSIISRLGLRSITLKYFNMNAKKEVPVLLLTGYLGSGKTTLLNKILANDNGIKDKKIKSLQYQLEHYSKRDTLILRDTVFRDPNFVLDTCIVDHWNKSCLHLQYPGTIALSNEYENEKFITLSSHREPIKPRKWFLPRWFTKKQTVVEVLVVDENPYVKTKQQRFVEIID